ncbi:MAG: AhpC/TSA family protein [Gammaproteobacteria bacterium]|nr:AhpC/TSA family protein [Gammaproteobacteria bacterium]MBU1478672.1 AhpC/TSA family protein [Gammaproteobacteria bacterium]MBU2000212.1 AhpC/TSA family protein [Gammaproteobacteria bacterium]MBU2133431.1 AhpC/TSA family protein [Gammaproteobacteria bacterium]MBU2186229.1 AhpC/TSA family protein [Gammaproteobacteria bacterium]
MSTILKTLCLAGTLLLTSFTTLAQPIAKDEFSISPLLNGQQIPKVNLQDIKGNTVDLAELTQKKPTIFFFYRGGWCPFCNNQMGQLKAIEPELLKMGFQLVGISPDTPAQLKASAAKNELKYLLLSDEKMQASQAFGLAFYTSKQVTDTYLSRLKLDNPLWTTPEGDKRLVLPVPAIYIADTQGLIHFQYVNPNYKVRPAPKLILTAASLVGAPE